MRLFNIILISAGALVALFTRIIIPFNKVFTDSGIRLNTPDAYCMIRYAEMMPYYGQDYFSQFPDGSAGLEHVVWPFLISSLGNLFHADYYLVAAVLPVACFIVTAILVYELAHTLYGGQVAALSVFVLCILPGEILSRTALGAGDYHAWETFLVTLIMGATVIAVKKRGKAGRILDLCAILLAIVLYWLSWAGALLVPVILSAAFTLHGFFNLSQGKFNKIQYAVLMSLAFIALVIIAIKNEYAPQDTGVTSNITETYPLFLTAGQFDISTMMAYYGITFYIVIFGLGWLAWRVIRFHRPEEILFFTWAAITCCMMLALRRFDYYFAICAAVIIAFISERIFRLFVAKHVVRFAVIGIAIISFPLIRQGIVSSSLDYGYPDQDWITACQWLRDQNDPTYELAYYRGSLPGHGTFAHWNYGYWLMAIGHQATWANNSSGDFRNNSGLLLTDETEETMKVLRDDNIRYVALDKKMQGYKSLQGVNQEASFMVQAYSGLVPGLELAYQAGEVKIYRLED